MARSLSTAKVFASLLNRRGYCAAASRGGLWADSPDKEGYMAQNKQRDPGNHEEKPGTQPSWAPDPVTGFYKPCDIGPDIISPVELREMVLAQRKPKPHN